MKLHWTLFILFISCSLFAQIEKPVTWSFDQKQISNNEFELIFTADIEEGWAIYSQYTEEGGPIPTGFYYEGEIDHYILEGENREESSNRKEGKEPLFDNMNVVKFFEDATFRQKVKISDLSKPISGYLEFMTCNDERCLPPTPIDFTFNLATPNAPLTKSQGEEQSENDGENISFEKLEQDLPFPADDEIANLKKPVSWKYEVKKIEDNVFEFMATAALDDGYNMYSVDNEGGPGPTEFFWEIEGIELQGEIIETSTYRKKEFDKIFDEEVIKIKNDGTWIQRYTVSDASGRLKGYISYVVCDDEACTFEEANFDVSIDGESTAMNLPVIPQDAEVVNSKVESLHETYISPLGDCGEEKETNKSLIWTFVLGFLGGLLALLTPCVFPMIPLTVSFFTKGSKDRASGIRNGLIYGASIIVIYVGIGLLITALFGATALNQLSTNWIANTLFFAIFVFFAFSFFGFYEITLPSSWSTRTDAMAERGGLIGTFFMAFTLALVSFSCTGPIIGSAIVESATSKIGPAVVMLGFSTALALPFGLFAAFPAWLNSLPQSGGWMNSVKVILGFLELALAFKFLSVADMTSHWGFLRYELFLGIWILIAALMAIYLFGGIKFPHDSPKVKLSIPRITFALVAVAFTVYFALGFRPDDRTKTYDSLALLSGIVPPPHYNFFKPLPEPNPDIKAKYPSFDKCANNLDCFKDYYEALAYAKEVNKPVFLDFTGYGCVNCRKVEDQIWVKDRVWQLLAKDYVMASLYVDDRKELDEVKYSSTTGEKLRNVGRLWADFQIANFKQNSQPLYVLVTPDQKVLSVPKTYIPSEGAKEYADYLECGLDQFGKHYSKDLLGSR